MEDVVLHYKPGSAAGLSSLIETTEKLLEPFPCRTPSVFTPWFPAAADRHLPIRPAKPAPIITCSGGLFFSGSTPHTHSTQKQEAGVLTEKPPERSTTTTTQVDPQILEDGICISETPHNLLPASLCTKPERSLSSSSPKKHKDGFTITDSPRKRSWSVSTQRGVLLQSPPSLSKQFHHMVSKHQLHLRQRAKWVISQHNCGGARDIEQVWRGLSQRVRSSATLPSCNANIQREQVEIWVFCDVLQAEQVGQFLKDELQLSGKIGLTVGRLGNVFSM